MMGLGLLPNGLALNEWLHKLPRFLPVGSSESQEVGRRGSMRLLKYKASPSALPRQALFVLPSLINRHYILDLLPGKSLIEFLTSQGFPVYLVDWGIPDDEDRYLDFNSLMENRVQFFLELAAEQETKSLHLLGHCLGGTLACMLAATETKNIQSLTLVTTPVHFPATGKLSIWAQHPHFDVEAFVEAYGHAPWALMQSAFLSLKPTMWIKKIQKLADKWKDPEFQKVFWALELWAADNISMLGSAYQTMLRDLYQKDALARGELQIGTQKVSLKNIPVPALNVFAQDDHIVAPEAVLKGSDLNANTSYREIPTQGGHVGSLINSRSQKILWPEISKWLVQQEAQVSA